MLGRAIYGEHVVRAEVGVAVELSGPPLVVVLDGVISTRVHVRRSRPGARCGTISFGCSPFRRLTRAEQCADSNCGFALIHKSFTHAYLTLRHELAGVKSLERPDSWDPGNTYPARTYTRTYTHTNTKTHTHACVCVHCVCMCVCACVYACALMCVPSRISTILITSPTW